MTEGRTPKHTAELKPYLNDIAEDDALKVLDALPSESVDMSFADPPFNLSKKYSLYNDKKETEEYLEWCRKWLDKMVRVTKPTGSIFVHNIPKWLTHFATILNENENAFFKHWIAWDAMGAPLGKTLLPNHYGILWYVKSKDNKFFDVRKPHETCRVCGEYIADYGGKKDIMHSFGSLLSDVWTDIHRIRHSKRRDEHPCQLPVPLLERLILMCTEEGDIVLDPFVGTGTTAIAAKRLGRTYVGIDLDPNYVSMSKLKLEAESPTRINGAYVSIFLDKVLTVRDADYPQIEHLLEQKEYRIGREKVKQQALPYFVKA